MKIGRNAPCPCGSGKKYKNCHGTYYTDEIREKADEGDRNATLQIGFTQRLRAYTHESLAALDEKKPINNIERIPLGIGCASSIPAGYDDYGMFQRVYKCLPNIWQFEEDPLILLFEEKKYQVELRRKDIRIVKSNTNWRLDIDKGAVWDVQSIPKALNPQGYYCCLTIFVHSHDHSYIETEGINMAEALAGFISIVVTPDLVRTPIWESTCVPRPSGVECRVNIRDNIFRVAPPVVQPEMIEPVNALASSSFSEPHSHILSTALRFISHEARSELDQDRFIWLYLAARIIVDDFYESENPHQDLPAQEQRFKFYVARHFPGESEIIDDFKKVYDQRNNLLKGKSPAVIVTEDVTRAEAICHKVIRCELEKRLSQ